MSVGYFTIDIERTGQGCLNDLQVILPVGVIESKDYVRPDKTFAIGWSHSDKTLTNITKSNVCLDLGITCSTDVDEMRAVWAANKFESRCFEEFWSNNLGMLAVLQDPTKVNLVSEEAEMAAALNKALEEAENMYNNLMLVFDNVTFDASWCNILLTKYGYVGLSYTRAGKYRWGYELDSFTYGALGLSPEVEWAVYSTAIELKINVIFSDIKIVHDHNPENDAMSILVKFIRVVNYLS